MIDRVENSSRKIEQKMLPPGCKQYCSKIWPSDLLFNPGQRIIIRKCGTLADERALRATVTNFFRNQLFSIFKRYLVLGYQKSCQNVWICIYPITRAFLNKHLFACWCLWRHFQMTSLETKFFENKCFGIFQNY